MDYVEDDDSQLETAKDSRKTGDTLDSLSGDGMVGEEGEEAAGRSPGREEYIPLLAESSNVVHPSTGVCDGVVLVHHHALHQQQVNQHLQCCTIYATTTQIVTPTSAQGPKSG